MTPLAFLLPLACALGEDSGDTAPSMDTQDTEDTAEVDPNDQDGDGYQVGEDCDDTDATVHPGAEDPAWCPCDGVDQDCNGVDGPADAEVSGLHLTETWRPAGDVDGDGHEDLFTWANDWEYGGGVASVLISGGALQRGYQRDDDVALATFDEGVAQLSVGDVDDDGFGEALGNCVLDGASGLCLFAGARIVEGGALSAADAAHFLPYELDFDDEMAPAGDVDGDGVLEVSIGQNALMLPVTALADPAFELADAPWSLSATSWQEVGDVDADGLDDRLRGSSLYLGALLGEGGEFTTRDAEYLRAIGEGRWGPSGGLAGDVNADGYDDLWFRGEGACLYLVSRPSDGVDVDEGAAFSTILPTDAIPIATLAHRVGDVDGDGHEEIAVRSDDDVEEVLWFRGARLLGTLTADEADRRASLPADHIGTLDYDGDGVADTFTTFWPDGQILLLSGATLFP